jgi:hypothetical protein
MSSSPFSRHRSRTISPAGTGSRLLFLLALLPSLGRADPGALPDQALAETLFREGKRLMLEERFGEACPKLEESQRIDSAGGTVLLLGLCLERQGRTASAWATFSSALSIAERERAPERASVASQHLQALGPRLVHLTVKLSPTLAATRGLEVRRDGVLLGSVAWGVATPVDPGLHVLEATASGRVLAHVELDTRGEGTHHEALLEVSSAIVSEGASSPSGPRPPPLPPPRATASPRPRWPGYAMVGLGAAALAVGTVTAVLAASKISEVNDRCPTDRCADREAKRLNDQAGRYADIATVALPLGVVSLGGGALWLWGGATRADGSRKEGRIGVAGEF